MRVVTLHGVGPHPPGYAAPLFEHLRILPARLPAFEPIELRWRTFGTRALAWWLLGVPGVMRRAQAGLDALVGGDPVVLVTHSAGCRIAYDWLLARDMRHPIAAWVSSGANAGILDGVALPFLGGARAEIPHWLHVYRTGDPLGGSLASFGAKDVEIPMPIMGPHLHFWEDRRFAAVVASVLGARRAVR